MLSVIAFIVVFYGCWKIERWVHYKFAYSSNVQAEIQTQIAPLEKRITKLEAEVKALKAK